MQRKKFLPQNIREILGLYILPSVVEIDSVVNTATSFVTVVVLFC